MLFSLHITWPYDRYSRTKALTPTVTSCQTPPGRLDTLTQTPISTTSIFINIRKVLFVEDVKKMTQNWVAEHRILTVPGAIPRAAKLARFLSEEEIHDIA
ncbi:hypothetical protein N7474_005498 [Penicillium riverlandense]|uniref:uncharacterized protein n=1 Tax=Penicillium riverlandense TaxID=1903569 RepID=UPI002546892C|nr:uncharacterized protein N7474_005498 [Penicillium riverlandense]KAJ5819907.1 hypothetical protein N7474_005498 [Penicillium riverlandense]